MRSRMALTICSQFLADIGRTEAISSSSLHFSNQSHSRRSESFTFCSPNELSALVRNKRMPLPKIPKCSSDMKIVGSIQLKRVTNHGRLSWPVGLCENGADLSRELNPIIYQHLVRYSPKRCIFQARYYAELLQFAETTGT